MKTTTLTFRNSIPRLPWQQGLSIIAVVLACFTLSPRMQAVSPPPDGGYSGANTAEGGTGTLFSLTTGSNNTALGSQALFSLTTGKQNTATGAQALKNNTADQNTANGFQALVTNTTGFDNTATGWRAMFKNNSGVENTAIGSQALLQNSTGQGNTAIGARALAGNLFDNQNTAVGNGAMGAAGGTSNTAIGAFALTSSGGDDNIALGSFAGHGLVSGDRNIYIGNEAGVFGTVESDTIRIGDVQTATFIAGISGAPVPGGVPVYVNTSGQLGTAPSSARFKEDIKPMAGVSEKLYALQPVTFHYKKEFDPGAIPQFGLVAEEVEKVSPDLVVRDRKGEAYTVRYDAVNAMLLNEFLKEHRKVEELEVNAAQQQKEIKALATIVKEQAAQIEKVSAQLEASKPTLQVTAN
jgi:uncharacterized coiled-coil protein SlyX